MCEVDICNAFQHSEINFEEVMHIPNGMGS